MNDDDLDEFMETLAELEASRVPPVAGMYGWYYTEDGLVPLTLELLEKLLDTFEEAHDETE